jgi:phosphatidylserine/phosphatidylglycerophosphate/cardiolipin synthase-like enzyme
MEVFEVFKGRCHRDLPGVPPTASPTPGEWGAPGRDVMQVAQTSFKPKPGSGTVGFDWAPQGNATIHDTIIRAIRSARECIYIEEQYMVPDDAYIAALTSAADHCKRLVIVLPSFLEIFFGDVRRTQMFQKLAGSTTQVKWGDRMLIGTPMRRPVLAAPDRITSMGRCTLLAGIGQFDSTIFLGPAARIPKGRFFFWIGGELMYATGSTLVTGPDGTPAKQLDVLRGGFGTSQRWCPDQRPHQQGEPATFSQPTGIFVHAKIMMIDDLFVSIGSTNVNRRGFFHDGEITAFAIPQDLRGAADNPARDLRTRLWAEQLGLAPDMGAALLADPIAGFELFRRSRYQGNRFVPLTELALPTPTLGDLPALADALPDWAKQFLQFGVQIALEAESDNIFNTLSDPTTLIDPNPTPGPGLPP